MVTNDDGVESPGLHALAAAMHHAGHEVIVVAPSGERSGSGAAIGRLHRAGEIAHQEVAWPDLEGVVVHALDVPPAAAVYAGLVGAFGPGPDVVASGVNPGLNYGHLVIHSGTVGAAMTAAVLGVPGVAVSIQFGEELHWGTAATLAVGAVRWAGDVGDGGVVNLNVPNLPLAQVRGVREGTLQPFNERWKAECPPGELLLEYEGHEHPPAPGTDYALVQDGWAAVTLLSGVTTASAAGLSDAVAGLLSPAA
jgi:5'-nucleotidase